MKIRYLGLFVVIILIVSCSSISNSMNIDTFIDKKIELENKEVSLTGIILKKKDGSYICSTNSSEEQCINLEYNIALKQLIADFSGSMVLLHGTYLPHDFHDDGVTIVPSRIRVAKIEKLVR